MAESAASAALRKLHEEATQQDCDCITPHAKQTNARALVVSLLPELAALVESAEAEHVEHIDYRPEAISPAACGYHLCRALAALTARLEKA